MPRHEQAFESGYRKARHCLDACSELIRKGDWDALRQQAAAYQDLAHALIRASAGLEPEARQRAMLSLIELSARHRRLMSLLAESISRISEDRQLLGEGMRTLRAQRALIS